MTLNEINPNDLAPYLLFFGTLVTVGGGYLGIRRSSKTQERQVTGDYSIDIISQYKELLESAKAQFRQDAEEDEVRFMKSLADIRKEMEDNDKRCNDKIALLEKRLDEAVATLAKFIPWHDGEKRPVLPAWLYEAIMKKKETK